MRGDSGCSLCKGNLRWMKTEIIAGLGRRKTKPDKTRGIKPNDVAHLTDYCLQTQLIFARQSGGARGNRQHRDRATDMNGLAGCVGGWQREARWQWLGHAGIAAV